MFQYTTILDVGKEKTLQITPQIFALIQYLYFGVKWPLRDSSALERHNLLSMAALLKGFVNINPDSKVHGANMGPIWGRQDPGEPHVGPMNFAIREGCHNLNLRCYQWWQITTATFGSGIWWSHDGPCFSRETNNYLSPYHNQLHQQIELFTSGKIMNGIWDEGNTAKIWISNTTSFSSEQKKMHAL